MDTVEKSNRRLEAAEPRRRAEREADEAPKARLREGGRWYPATDG